MGVTASVTIFGVVASPVVRASHRSRPLLLSNELCVPHNDAKMMTKICIPKLLNLQWYAIECGNKYSVVLTECGGDDG